MICSQSCYFPAIKQVSKIIIEIFKKWCKGSLLKIDNNVYRSSRTRGRLFSTDATLHVMLNLWQMEIATIPLLKEVRKHDQLTPDAASLYLLSM